MKKTRAKNQLLKYLWQWYMPQLKNEKIDYIFFSRKYEHIYQSMPNKKSIVFVPLKKLSLIQKDDNIIYTTTKLFDYFVQKIFKNDPQLQTKSSQKYIDFTVQIFKQINPKLFIVHNDSLFIERFLIYCAKKADVKTICIQHGLFQSASDPYVLDGKYADIMLAWSEQQKEILIKSGIPASNVQVLGYPHKIYKLKNNSTKFDSKKICILGQPWEGYQHSLGKMKKAIFQKIIDQFDKHQVAYKPHPNERDQDYFPNNIQIFDRSLNEAIEEFDYFFSLTSSALLEVSLSQKIAIQIYDQNFQCDNFEDIGISYTVQSSNLEDIIKYISTITKPFDIDKKALSLPHNIDETFNSFK